MSSARFDASAQVVLDASGAAVATIAAPGAFTRLQLTRVSVVGAARANVAMYRGGAYDPNYLDGTDAADNDTSELALALYPGEYLTFVWSGGTPGARMTANVEGFRL